LQRQIDRDGLANHVQLRGFVQDVRTHLARAHVFVSSSLSEGLPLSVLEAMASSLPVVTSDVGGLGELIQPGQNGCLYPSRSLPDLVGLLRRLEQDEGLRLTLAERARETIEQRFSMTRCAQGYVRIYEELLVGSRGGHR
jgi:glycosyltransferase involved in cell wall biosynthesis